MHRQSPRRKPDHDTPRHCHKSEQQHQQVVALPSRRSHDRVDHPRHERRATKHHEVAVVGHRRVGRGAESEVAPRQHHEQAGRDDVTDEHSPAASQAQRGNQHDAERERVVLPRTDNPDRSGSNPPHPHAIPASHEKYDKPDNPDDYRVDVPALEKQQPRSAHSRNKKHQLTEPCRHARKPDEEQARHHDHHDAQRAGVCIRQRMQGDVLQPQHTRPVDGRILQAAVVGREDVKAEARAVDALEHQREVPELHDALRHVQPCVDARGEVGVARSQRPPRHDADHK